MRRGLCGVAVAVLWMASAHLANAVVVLRGTTEERQHNFELLQEISQDYRFTMEWDESLQHYILVKHEQLITLLLPPPDATGDQDKGEAQSEPSNRTPLGCALITALINSSRRCFVDFNPPPRTQPYDAQAARGNPPGGSDAVVRTTHSYYYVYVEGEITLSRSRPTGRMPPFLMLAHELIHALHSMTGTWNTNAAEEEFTTIHGTPPNSVHPKLTANAIREEQSALEGTGPGTGKKARYGERVGHGGMLGSWAPRGAR